MRKTLFWKEMRELVPVLGVLVALETLLCLSFRFARHLELTRELVAGIALFAAAVVGTSLFAHERRPGTLSFLFSLPVGRGSLLTAKLRAGLLTLSLAAVGGILAVLAALRLDWLVRIGPHWDDPVWWTAALAAMLLGLLIAVRLSMSWPEPLTPLLAGAGVAGLALWGIARVGERGVAVAAVTALGTVGLTTVWVRRGFSFLEDRAPRWTEGRLSQRGSGVSWPLLTEIEWRQKKGLVVVFALLPLLSLPAARWVSSVFLSLWALLAGATFGASLFTRPERDGVRSLLHHLPLTRSRLVAARLVAGIVLGLAYLVEYLVILLILSRQGGWIEANGQPTGLAFSLLIFGLGYLASFLTGAALSPWLRSTVLAVFLALVSSYASILALATVFGVGRGVGPLIAWVAGVAWWSNVHSRAFEPQPWKDLRATAVLIMSLAVLALVIYAGLKA